MKSLLCIFSVLFLLAFSHREVRAQEIIPADRRIRWEPGIPGGIPGGSGPVENILDHGADPTGVEDSGPAIEDALHALPASGGVVLVPEGVFRVGGAIHLGRDHVVLRGRGWKSKLLLEAGGDGLQVTANRPGDWQDPQEPAEKGDTLIVVEDGSLFSPGGFAEVEQDNDSALMYTITAWNVDWAEHSVGQLFRVDTVAGDTLTVTPPVNLDFSPALHVRVRPQGLVQYVGIENLYLEKTTPQGSTVLFTNTAFCWIRHIQSYHTRRSHINLVSSLNDEIRDSYFHHSFSYGGGGSGYGVECGKHVTGTLVENNIFDSLRHAMLIHLGANGNVYGYNYSVHPVQGDGETNLNQGWIPPDVSVHGHYPFMNLFEGNRVEEIGIADYWGPAGPGNTYFRNKVAGEGIFYYDASHAQNLVGNVTTGIEDLPQLAEDKLEHGNVVAGNVQWDPDIESRDLPPSLYLDTAPSFFEGYPWPPFGPDAGTGDGLPAKDRFESILLGQEPGKGTPPEQVLVIYPNPCRSRVQVWIPRGNSSYRLLSFTGQVLEAGRTAVPGPVTLDLSGRERGVYLLRIRDRGGSWTATGKIIRL